jgi:hypothetical protein
VDCLTPAQGEEFLVASLAATPGTFIEAPALIYLKLKSPRHRDRSDVIELIKSGIDVDACRRYLDAHAPSMRAALEEAIARAAAEE